MKIKFNFIYIIKTEQQLIKLLNLLFNESLKKKLVTGDNCDI